MQFACPHASDSIRTHSGETRPTRCAAIFVYCSVREWTRFAGRVENIQTRHPHVIGFVADSVISFNSGERIQKYQICCRIRRMRVDGSRIWKEKDVDPNLSGYMWTELKSCSSACIGLSDLYVRF